MVIADKLSSSGIVSFKVAVVLVAVMSVPVISKSLSSINSPKNLVKTASLSSSSSKVTSNSTYPLAPPSTAHQQDIVSPSLGSPATVIS